MWRLQTPAQKLLLTAAACLTAIGVVLHVIKAKYLFFS